MRERNNSFALNYFAKLIFICFSYKSIQLFFNYLKSSVYVVYAVKKFQVFSSHLIFINIAITTRFVFVAGTRREHCPASTDGAYEQPGHSEQSGTKIGD